MTDYNSHTSFVLGAPWVLPITSPPVKDAVVVIEDGRITAVDTRESYLAAHPNESVMDFKEAIITPGLVNLHTHLDYSALRHFDTQSPFFAWIKGLAGTAFQWSSEEWLSSALSGACEIALSGTSLIADSSYSGAAARAAARVGLRAVVGLELFGVNSNRAETTWSEWLNRFGAFQDDGDEPLCQAIEARRLILTVAPHAPYTVCPQLWERAAQWALAHSLPILAHVSESAAECRWMASDDQELSEFLLSMVPGGVDGGIEALEWRGLGRSPSSHLSHFGLLNANTLAAHAVQLSADDIALFARHDVKIAHCPRSNSRLRCGFAPLSEITASGVKLGFGTDSAASTDDLDVLSEARFALNLRRALEPAFSMSAAEALRRLTLGGAEILGLADEVGSLDAGKKADIAVFKIDKRADYAQDRPYELLVYGAARATSLLVDGRWVVRDGVVNSLLVAGRH